jgi:hypothetical protein
MLRDFLVGRDAPCPGCGYNLRGITGSQCPECGAAVSLSLCARPPMARKVRRLIGVFAGLTLVSNLVRSAWNAWWLYKYAGSLGSFPNTFVIVEFGVGVIMQAAICVAIVIMLGRALLARGAVDRLWMDCEPAHRRWTG